MHAERKRFGLRACAAVAACAVVVAAASGRSQEPPPDMAPPPFDAPLEPSAELVDPATGPTADAPLDGDVPPPSDAVPPGAAPSRTGPTAPFSPPPAAPPGFADGTASVIVSDPPRPPSQAASAATQRRIDAADSVADLPAARLLADALVPPPAAFEPTRTGAPAGRPVPLLEALERSGDRARRLWITQSYWKLAAAHGQMRFASLALERVELVAPGGDPHDRAALDVATAAARADLAAARADFGVAQQELVDLCRLPPIEPLPWPADHPLVGPYETHFDAIFATRVATGRVRAIVRTLPARHDVLEARAAAADAARAAVELVEADHAKGMRPIEAVLAAHAALGTQERAFVEAVRVYNLEIAEYAMAVADLSVPDDRFVSMLIAAPIQWRQQPAAAPPAGGALVPDAVTN